jgi:ribosomal protein L13
VESLLTGNKVKTRLKYQKVSTNDRIYEQNSDKMYSDSAFLEIIGKHLGKMLRQLNAEASMTVRWMMQQITFLTVDICCFNCSKGPATN